MYDEAMSGTINLVSERKTRDGRTVCRSLLSGIEYLYDNKWQPDTIAGQYNPRDGIWELEPDYRQWRQKQRDAYLKSDECFQEKFLARWKHWQNTYSKEWAKQDRKDWDQMQSIIAQDKSDNLKTCRCGSRLPDELVSNTGICRLCEPCPANPKQRHLVQQYMPQFEAILFDPTDK